MRTTDPMADDAGLGGESAHDGSFVRREEWTSPAAVDIAAGLTPSARGEIDSHTVQRLHELMWHRLASCSEVVVLDLSAITYCNTSGLQLLDQCRLRAEERDISLRVVPDRYGLLARLLDITGTRERFALRANAVTAAHAE